MRIGKRCAAAAPPCVTALVLSLAACAAIYCAGCSRAAKEIDRAHDAAAPPGPKTITPDDLKRLRWIEGAWRGTGDAEPPFFERYRFDGDSALIVESFEDGTLGKVTETTRFEIRNGQFGNWEGAARWAATQLDANSVTFEPAAGARNSFRWQRGDSADAWKAVLDWPPNGDKPARRRTYNMERWAEPKKN